MPSRTTSVKPRCFTSARESRAAGRDRPAPAPTTCSQPSHLSSSVPVHSDCVAGPEAADAPVLAPGLHLRLDGRLHLRRARLDLQAAVGRPRAASRRRRAMVPSSLSNASANCCTPSVDQLVGDRRPARCRCCSSVGERRAGARDVLLEASGVTLPWSRNASIVAGGMVLTVSRPISASTYSVSL